LLVAGNDWKNVAEACAPLQGFMVMNPKYSDGLATSLAMGIRTVNDLASGALILLADQPLVTAEHVKLLVDAWEASTDSICAGSYAGTLGPPVIFPARLFPELIALRGDRGAKAVIDANRNSVVTIRLDDAAVDIDRPEDLHQIQQ
jgi:CTP:molybdopterin cytidylyltransferase MocA